MPTTCVNVGGVRLATRNVPMKYADQGRDVGAVNIGKACCLRLLGPEILPIIIIPKVYII